MLLHLGSSHAMMVEVAGSDPAESGRRIVAVQHNGDGAVATDPSWTRPAQSYTVVIERDAVYAADGDNCSTRAQETWYVYCHEPMPDSQSCFALEIVDMACIPPGADDAP